MELEITVTPRETLVWAAKPEVAQELRHELEESGYLVRDADPFELTSVGLIPEGEHLEFDPVRIFDVGIGPNANASLHALTDSGHSLVWHRWQTRLARKVWGVPVAIPRKGRPRAVGIERATHFGTAVRSHFGLGLRISRETYATINKRSSLPRWNREDNPRSVGLPRLVVRRRRTPLPLRRMVRRASRRALQNFDLNMAHFASLDREEFERALQSAVASRRGMVEVTDLTKWDGVPRLYIMVLDEYCQVHVGVANSSTGIAKRIRQHWTNQKQFDRLIWGDVTSSILSIDSFRALNTTRIFALKTERTFDDENLLLEQLPREFTLNRVMGGNDVVHLASFLGVGAVMRTREFENPASQSQAP